MGVQAKLDEGPLRAGFGFCPGLQTTTVAGPMLRVLTIQAALTAKPNRDQREKPPIFKRILELSS
jgi:hypothetical protein